jgi:hypothetical protein
VEIERVLRGPENAASDLGHSGVGERARDRQV